MALTCCLFAFGVFAPYVIQRPLYGIQFLIYKHFFESFVIIESLLGIQSSFSKLLGAHSIEFYSSLSFNQIICNTYILTYSFGFIVMGLVAFIETKLASNLDDWS